MRTIHSVTQSCFFTKDTLSVGFICRWLTQNLPNLIMPLHRFCVHTLTTVYRTIETEVSTNSTAEHAAASAEANKENPLSAALNREMRKLNEAAVERTAHEYTGNTLPNTSGLGHLMSLSQSWLLAAALPNVFTRFQDRKMPAIQPQPSERLELPEGSTVSIPSIDAAATPPISHLMTTIPIHWSLLYNSQQHGVGSNRFLHHVIGYKGPTLVLLHSETDEIFCLASPSEWRETHLYTGSDDCHIIQLLPKFAFVLLFDFFSFAKQFLTEIFDLQVFGSTEGTEIVVLKHMHSRLSKGLTSWFGSQKTSHFR